MDFDKEGASTQPMTRTLSPSGHVGIWTKSRTGYTLPSSILVREERYRVRLSRLQ